MIFSAALSAHQSRGFMGQLIDGTGIRQSSVVNKSVYNFGLGGNLKLSFTYNG